VRLIASGKPVGIVFMGDSITEGWESKHPAHFAYTSHVCRTLTRTRAQPRFRFPF